VQLRADAGNQEVTLYWPMVPGADTYNIYMGTSISSLTKITTTPATLTSAPYIVTSLTNETTYYFAFTAVNTSTGESALSEITLATPQGSPIPPEFPKNVRANAGDTEITVTWTPVDGAEVYNIYQYENLTNLILAAEIKSTDSNCSISQCSFIATGLTNETPYFFYLTAENHTSGKSNEVWATPPGSSGTQSTSSDLTAPQNVNAAAGDKMLTLTWTAPIGASPNTFYNVYYDTTSTIIPTADKKFPKRSSPWPFSGLTNGTTYYLYLTAVLASGPSFAAYATPSGSPPPAAPFITAVTPGDGTVRIDWNTVTGAASYNVYSSNVMGLSKEVYSGKATGTGNSFTATDLTNDTKYYFVVTAVGTNTKESAESNEVSATPHL
jgi:fibronectin type 3 domain-containing protein